MKRGVYRIQHAKVDRIHVDCRAEKKMVRTKTQIHFFVVVRILSVCVWECCFLCVRHGLLTNTVLKNLLKIHRQASGTHHIYAAMYGCAFNSSKRRNKYLEFKWITQKEKKIWVRINNSRRSVRHLNTIFGLMLAAVGWNGTMELIEHNSNVECAWKISSHSQAYSVKRNCWMYQDAAPHEPKWDKHANLCQSVDLRYASLASCLFFLASISVSEMALIFMLSQTSNTGSYVEKWSRDIYLDKLRLFGGYWTNLLDSASEWLNTHTHTQVLNFRADVDAAVVLWHLDASFANIIGFSSGQLYYVYQ